MVSVSVSPPTQPRNYILIPRATLLRLGSDSERAQLGEPDLEEATWTRGERPVTG